MALFVLCPSLLHASSLLEKGKLLLEQGRFSQVEGIAKEIIRKDKADGWGLKGMLYFYKGDYPASIKWLRKAAQKKEERWKGYLSFVARTGQLTSNFITEESTHFIFRLDERDRILLDFAREAMERAYHVLGSSIGYFPEGKTIIEIYPTTEGFNFASSLSKRDMEVSGAIAICKFNRLMLLSPRNLAFGYRWLDALTHEYTHFLINRKTGYNCPLWLHEGIAKYHETLWRSPQSLYFTSGYESILYKGVKEKSLISFARMEPSMVKLDTQEQVQLAFAQVSHAIEYMFKEYGQNSVKEVLEELGKGASPGRSFKRALGIDMEEFEKEWRTYLLNLNLRPFRGVAGEKVILKEGEETFDEEEYISQKVRLHLRLGDRFRKRRRDRMAIIQYKKALQEEPYNPVVLNRVGMTEAERGNTDLAEESFHHSLDYNPNYVTTLVHLGKLYLKKGKDEGKRELFYKAARMYEDAIGLNPFHPEIHKNLGWIWKKLGKEKKARKCFERAALLLPLDREVQGWLKELEE